MDPKIMQLLISQMRRFDQMADEQMQNVKLEKVN